MYDGVPSSVAASVLCKAMLSRHHQRRSQPMPTLQPWVAAPRRAAGARWARSRSFAHEDAQALGPRAQQLGVRWALSPFFAFRRQKSWHRHALRRKARKAEGAGRVSEGTRA